MSQSTGDACDHSALHTTPSPFADEVCYHSRDSQQLFTASTGSRKRVHPVDKDYLDLYPAPLILPDDELAHDPAYPAQSFTNWKNEKERNAVTTERGVVYVAEYPGWTKELMMGKLITRWSTPDQGVGAPASPPPPIDDVLTYLQTFFHGMPVKKTTGTLAFTHWTDGTTKSLGQSTKNRSKARTKASEPWHMPSHVGLVSSTSGITTRIRVRHRSFPEPTYPLDAPPEPYSTQLNLNDLLDHAIAILPTDAYALLLLVDLDLYEDEDDDFCVGRAYGGSRIAVVSGARYRPELDHQAGINLASGHWWPGSHCEDFIQTVCGDESKPKQKVKKRMIHVQTRDKSPLRDDSPLQRAVTAHSTALKDYMNDSGWSQSGNLFARRLCLTASHELLHCFGLDHCVYFACAMQGTASLREDSRQPPYLCPICENKLAAAIALKVRRDEKMEDRWWDGVEVKKWREDRGSALIKFCGGREQGDLGFAALGTWYRRVLELRGTLGTASST